MHAAPREQTHPIEVRGVSAAYEDPAGSHRSKRGAGAPVLAVEDVSLHLAKGELLAVLGPNGAGKSTLLKLLSGAMAPSRGQVHLFGKPIADHDRRAVAQRVAVVPQLEQVAFAFSVREVVRMGRAPHLGGWLRLSSEDEAIVEDAITRCDLVALQDRPASALSGGERKRVAIARALAQRPRVLLLDEPGAFLDVRHALALYDLLTEAIAREELACLVVMHDLNIAAQYASRAMLMKEGRVIALGGIDEVMTYAHLKTTFDTDLYAGENELTGTRFFLPMRASMRK